MCWRHELPLLQAQRRGLLVEQRGGDLADLVARRLLLERTDQREVEHLQQAVVDALASIPLVGRAGASVLGSLRRGASASSAALLHECRDIIHSPEDRKGCGVAAGRLDRPRRRGVRAGRDRPGDRGTRLEIEHRHAAVDAPATLLKWFGTVASCCARACAACPPADRRTLLVAVDDDRDCVVRGCRSRERSAPVARPARVAHATAARRSRRASTCSSTGRLTHRARAACPRRRGRIAPSSSPSASRSLAERSSRANNAVLSVRPSGAARCGAASRRLERERVELVGRSRAPPCRPCFGARSRKLARRRIARPGRAARSTAASPADDVREVAGDEGRADAALAPTTAINSPTRAVRRPSRLCAPRARCWPRTRRR